MCQNNVVRNVCGWLLPMIYIKVQFITGWMEMAELKEVDF
jgi:hypothetical protein